MSTNVAEFHDCISITINNSNYIFSLSLCRKTHTAYRRTHITPRIRFRKWKFYANCTVLSILVVLLYIAREIGLICKLIMLYIYFVSFKLILFVAILLNLNENVCVYNLE